MRREQKSTASPLLFGRSKHHSVCLTPLVLQCPISKGTLLSALHSLCHFPWERLQASPWQSQTLHSQVLPKEIVQCG